MRVDSCRVLWSFFELSCKQMAEWERQQRSVRFGGFIQC